MKKREKTACASADIRSLHRHAANVSVRYGFHQWQCKFL